MSFNNKNKGFIKFFVLILLAIIAFFLNFYIESQKIQKENEVNAKILNQQKIAHQKKMDELCVFPTGYAPTVSGYFFKIKAFYEYMQPFMDADRKRLGESMELYPLKIDYEIGKDNKCYVKGFSFYALWDGKKIIPNFDRNYPTAPSEPRTQLNIEVCYSCGKPYWLGKTSTEGKQVFWLKNYKHLYFMLNDKLIDKQGNYLADLGGEHHIFYVTNFENEGLEYHFSCLGLGIGTESFPISTDKLQERKAQHQWGCLATSEARFSRVMFEGGSISSDFRVHVLSDIVLFLNSLKALGIQSTAKGDKK